MNSQKFISPLISSQFPQFYKEEGPNFIAFVKAYYEWMEQSDPEWIASTTFHSRSISDYRDIDNTTQDFIKYFKHKYISSLPDNIISDKRLLVKHILDLYRSKGTTEAYKLLFRIFFNEDIDIYIPYEHVFNSSAATWYLPRYIEVSDSPFLKLLPNKKITGSGGATAVVESFFVKNIKGKQVNVLYLSNILGDFQYGQQIYCEQLPEINEDNAPMIVGSLTTISIDNGGYGFNVGDELSVEGSGNEAVVVVSSVRNENGKVKFNLIDGGYGFSIDALVTVTGGNGSGAKFKVGDITDKQVYVLNTDYIKYANNLMMDIYTQGYKLGISASTGNFDPDEPVSASALSTHIHVQYLETGVGFSGIANGEMLSNTILNISGLTVYKSDDNLLYLTGSESDLTNANLMPNVILTSDTTSSIVSISSTYPLETITGAGVIDGDLTDGSNLYIYNDTPIGYFVPGSIITGQNGESAMIETVERLTYWDYFPARFEIDNLDSKLGDTLRWINKVIGKITFINGINPGSGYSSSPTVSVLEPLIADLAIEDGKGGYWGNNALVTAKAGSATGIVSSITILDAGFSYDTDENVTLVSQTSPVVVTGTTVVDVNGVNRGYWKDRKGFTSDLEYLIDSRYYQAYSYEIVSRKMFNTYESFVRDLIHPSGFALYGRYAITTEMVDQESEPVYFDLSR